MAAINNIISLCSDTNPDIWSALKAALPALCRTSCELLKQGLAKYTHSILVEPSYLCKDHRNLFSNFFSKKFAVPSSVCSRLHFFTHPHLMPGSLLKDPELKKTYLGYSVIRPVHKRQIGRTVIDARKVGRRIEDDCYCIQTPFKVHINGIELIVDGYPYISQDTEATVCAHAALWGVCRYLSERYSIYPEMYPYDIVRMTASNRGRKIPYRGLTFQDYSTILTDFGCFPIVESTKETSEDKKLIPESFLDMCAYVESGFPILASLPNHAVALIGHTINRNRAFKTDKKNGFANHADILQQFIVVDDNFFPYQLLGFLDDPENYGRQYPSQYSIESIRAFVCPLPEKVFLPADKAREECLKVLGELVEQFGDRAFSWDRSVEPLVTRLFVTSSTSFKRRKLEFALQTEPMDKQLIRISQINLPHFVWVMEVSPKSLFTKGRCTGEVVLDCTGNTLEGCMIYTQVGDRIYDRDRAYPPSNKSYPQYTHNLGEKNQ